jgi:hypothetical protein
MANQPNPLSSQWVRIYQRCAREKERNDRERDGRNNPRVHDMLVELAFHGRAATLERTSSNDEWDDPPGVRIHKTLFFA